MSVEVPHSALPQPFELGVQPHTLGVPPPPQLWPVLVQSPPHAIGWPQPLSIVPQFAPDGHEPIVGAQPHTLATPPPPQLSWPPQLPQT